MSLWQHYHLPDTVESAVADLARYQGRARIVAGGTDLLLELQQGHKPPVEALVDVTRVPAMRHILQVGEHISVGAAVTHTEIVGSDLLRRRATCLVESCGVIGGPQVRNVATLGGNVAHGLPAGDGTISLLALGAEAEVAGASGSGWRPMAGLFAGPGLSTVDQTSELIVRFRFSAGDDRDRTSFYRVMRPQGVALPILGMAVWARFEADRETVAECRIAIGPAGLTPLRATGAEVWLRGKTLGDEMLAEAGRRVLEQSVLRTSRHRATMDYRVELIPVLVRRNFEVIRRRIRQSEAELTPERVGLG